MPQFKFWNIGEANAEIDRQASEIVDLKQKLAAAGNSEQLAADLKVANQTISTLVAERDAAKFEAKSETEARVKLTNGHAKAMQDLEASVETRASAKAREIAAAQGLPEPLKQKPASGAAASCSRKEFSVMTPIQQATHVRSGGTITE